jgi:hypothetical protein
MHVSDDLRIGPVSIPNDDATLNGNPAPMELGVGPLGRVYVWDIVPLTLQVAGLAASQNPGSGASFTLAAGTGVTSRVRPDGTTEYVLDVPRCVTVKATGANTATYTITGYDQYGQRMSQTIAAPSTSTVATTKAFKTVISVTNANATAGTNGLEVGFNDKFGLPLRVTDAAYVVNVKWNATLAADAGTFVAADTTSPATASTTDVRGCFTPSSAANGTKRLVMLIALPALACGPNATRVGAVGVTQA